MPWCDFSWLILPAVLWVLCTCIFYQIWKIFCYFFKYFSCLSTCSFLNSNFIYIRFCLILSNKSLGLRLFIFSVFLLCGFNLNSFYCCVFKLICLLQYLICCEFYPVNLELLVLYFFSVVADMTELIRIKWNFLVSVFHFSLHHIHAFLSILEYMKHVYNSCF